jgi:hypothetical protein
MTNRHGAVTLAELLLVTCLFAGILAGVARFAHSQNRLAALQRDRIRLEESVRTGRLVLAAELRFLAPGDVAAVGPDSIRIRAFRGGGAACRGAPDGAVHVVYGGVRQPDPGKDSVLVLSAHETLPARLVSWSASPECDGSVRMTLDPTPGGDAAYVLLFETGAYSVSGGALRYRRGGGGRQPLTEALFRDMAMEAVPRGVRVRFGVDDDSLPRLPGRVSHFQALSLNHEVVP